LVSEARFTLERRALLLGGLALIATALVGALAARSFGGGSTASSQPKRPIVQIVRPQPGLPSLADIITRLCPSMASIVPGKSGRPGSTGLVVGGGAPAFVVSADGWLVTTASIKPAARMHAVFGDGSQADISEVRTDPISGLAIAKAGGDSLTPIEMLDQAFPRVGDFGFSLQSPSGNGCSSETAMIAGDFLADGGGPVSYVRVQSPGAAIPVAAPFLNSDGQATAIAISDPAVPGAMLPSAIAGIVIDELIRKTPSPSIAFGFRSTDFSPTLADRLVNARLRGAGVAIVAPGSTADESGLHAGDVVVVVNGSPVSSASELGRALDAISDKAVLTVMRGDRRMTMTIPRTKGVE
jgi:S1-C subfamily serine protease